MEKLKLNVFIKMEKNGMYYEYFNDGLIKYEGNYFENQCSGEHKKYIFHKNETNEINETDDINTNNHDVNTKHIIYKNGICKNRLTKNELC